MTCVECGRVATETARGWRAYLVESEEDATRDESVFYCPDCAIREFGPVNLRRFEKR